MAAEVVPIVNYYCYRDDISSCEEKEKTTSFYSRHADVSFHVGLYSCMVYGSYRVWYRRSVTKVHILYVPLESGGNVPNGCVGVMRPSRLSA